ncbi:hypothetical protein GWO43_03805 [candidate division KSB1 bacterium]|nr:hypothetical protein [candidate division KSB1 bacterium]NIS23167.1 hypothetical protein [candidate division KSB1 bacterium]NIT70026.1 hypothetical protein [candidate division KSB1 bacterium]NIU23664.1 hypothetical protein [candidate division KSB1 bacterium]NIU91422.1 hypothetical protein [candidate division KSB1 bacterium]
MNYQHQTLVNRINKVCRRWKTAILLKGGAKVLIVAITAFLIAFALDSLVELSHPVRFALLGILIAVTLTAIVLEIVRPLLKVPNHSQLARYIEEKHPDLEDRLVSAVELGGGENVRISPQILEKLLEDTRFRVEPLNLSKTIRTKGAVLWSSFATVTAFLLGLFILSNLDLFSLKSGRIFAPWNIPEISFIPKLNVTPGNTRVPRGSTQEIRAELSGFEAEAVNIYFSGDDSSWSKLEMDPTETKDMFLFNFLDLQAQTKYYVKADDRLSDIYTISVYDAPQIKRVDLTYDYPEYTGLKKKREANSGDVWAPQGTTVKVVAVADKPLTQAAINLKGDKELRTVISSDTVVVASFKVTQDSYYRIHVTDTDGLTNEPAPEYYVHALPDQPPILSIDWPGRDIKATMVEEVPIKVHVQDDYGLKALKLLYTVNGDAEKQVALHDQRVSQSESSSLEEFQEFEADNLFYLEDLDVQPGDFLTYHAQAIDNSEASGADPISSDIYFITIRPFEQEFTRPMSQGQPGGAAGFGGRLSQTQKDIIVATWKLLNKEKDGGEKFAESLNVITESQKNLKEVTQNTLFQMEQRALFSDDSGDNMSQFYVEAIKAMEQALDELDKPNLEDALTFERKSYRNLLKAEAQITSMQIQRSRAGGPGNTAALEELAQLFEDEMDKLKNKYETERQNFQRQNSQAIDESLQKVKELARRQQQFNRQLRDLERKNLPPEEKKRRIQELRRQQEQLRQETRRLAQESRQMQRQNSHFPREMQESLRRAMQEMTNTSNNLSRDNSDLARAKGQQALNKLRDLEDLLRRNQKESLRRQLKSLQQEFQNLAKEQKELTNDLANLPKKDDQEKRQQELQKSREKQARLKEDFTRAQEHIKSLSNQATRNRNKASRELRKFSKDLQREEIEKKMETAGNLLKEDRLNSAQQAGQDIQKMLERNAEKLTQLRSEFAESVEEKMDVALDQTRKLRENLESAKRQAERETEGRKKGERGGEDLAREEGRPREAGPGETERPPQEVDPTKLDWWNEELSKSMKDLEFIRQSLQVDSSLSRQAREINENLTDIMRTFTGGDPQRLDVIEQQILTPLKNFEAELAQKLDLIKNKEKLFLAREEKIPPEYKDMVEKYYEALSETN